MQVISMDPPIVPKKLPSPGRSSKVNVIDTIDLPHTAWQSMQNLHPIICIMQLATTTVKFRIQYH